MVGRLPDDPLLHRVPYLLEAAFTDSDLPAIRQRLQSIARGCGLSGDRADDWVIAVNELMANAVRHGGGGGRLCVWRDEDLHCEVRDDGPGFDTTPYVRRREPPTPSVNGGMGLWIAQQVTHGMDVSSGPTGTVVVLRMSLSG